MLPAGSLRKERRYRDVDDPPADEEWRALHRLADANVQDFMIAFEDAVDILRNPNETELRAALLREDPFGAVDAFPWVEFVSDLGNAAAPLYEKIVVGGSRIAAPFLDIRLQKQREHETRLSIGFDLINERAVQFAALRSGALIRELEPGTLTGIRRVIRDGMAGQLTIDDMLRRIRTMVGLTERQVQAVLNRLARLARQGATARQLERARQTHAARLLSWRAENIARTETIRSANFGQRVLWEEAANEGLLERERWLQEWIAVVPTDGRTCEICIMLDQERVPLNTNFSTGSPQPPEHPSCRCALGLYEIPEGEEL